MADGDGEGDGDGKRDTDGADGNGEGNGEGDQIARCCWWLMQMAMVTAMAPEISLKQMEKKSLWEDRWRWKVPGGAGGEAGVEGTPSNGNKQR